MNVRQKVSIKEGWTFTRNVLCIAYVYVQKGFSEHKLICNPNSCQGLSYGTIQYMHKHTHTHTHLLSDSSSEKPVSNSLTNYEIDRCLTDGLTCLPAAILLLSLPAARSVSCSTSTCSPGGKTPRSIKPSQPHS